MFHHFLNSEFLPTAMQTLGIGLVTIFIPVVIALLQDIEDAWDRAVIFEKVVRVKITLLGFGLAFIPTFFWYERCWRLIFFGVFIAGVWLLIWILNNCYNWLRALPTGGQYDNVNYRNKLRIEYLSDKGNWTEKERIWIQTWEKKATDSRIEQDLIKQFNGNIDALIEAGEYEIVARYLRVFYAEREKRMWVGWVMFGDFFTKVLEWHFIFYEKEKRVLADPNVDDRYVFEVNAALLQLLRALVGIGLESAAYIFFEHLKKHMVGKSPEYVQHLLIQAICDGVFETGGGRESYDVWNNYFPAEWKVTKATLNDRDNFISKIWLNRFFEWAQRRIWSPTQPFDNELDDVAEGLFPEIDPIWWSAILALMMGAYGEGGRIKSWVERHKNFGYASRIGLGSYGSPEEASRQLEAMIVQQRADTVELAVLLFPRDLSAEKINQYLTEIKALHYPEGAKEEFARKEYQQILEAIQKKQTDGS
jgi:hypothetical protein